jgi:transposase
MAYVGLVPSESTSSDKRRQGGITKTGNSHARCILIECATDYAVPPKVSKEVSHRQSGQAREVLALSWKAQNRLHSPFYAFGRKATSAQQNRRGDRPRTLRLHLGPAAQRKLLLGNR